MGLVYNWKLYFSAWWIADGRWSDSKNRAKAQLLKCFKTAMALSFNNIGPFYRPS